MQRDFHRNMTLAVIHKIFKDDIDENTEQLHEELHVGAQGNPLYFRDRTYYTAMFMAALAHALEQSDVRIYTPSHRVFQKMSDLVTQFLCGLPVAGKLIHVTRAEDKPLFYADQPSMSNESAVKKWASRIGTAKVDGKHAVFKMLDYEFVGFEKALALIGGRVLSKTPKTYWAGGGHSGQDDSDEETPGFEVYVEF